LGVSLCGAAAGPPLMVDYGPHTEKRIAGVLEALERYGSQSIIALEGVPGTGKSFIGSISAQRFAGHPELVREVQFHPAVSYEEFVEGLRIEAGGVVTKPGILLDWNDRALDDPTQKYVLLIEELTRANIAAVLGELMTYLEYRDRVFTTLYSRRPIRIMRNLAVLATYNPADRTALEIDNALLRRLRIIHFGPDVNQLDEMLKASKLSPQATGKLKDIFLYCEKAHPNEFTYQMPFGHGIFAGVVQETPDLYLLWEERIKHMLYRPLARPHPFADQIKALYPWRDQAFTAK
jgi:5-methylcytosine-specific restriction protein B